MVSDLSATSFTAQLKPNSLNIAKRNLHRQGFETFAPMVGETRRRSGKFVTRTVPLFPGYIFVALDVRQGLWRAVKSTDGVSRQVEFGGGGGPSPVPGALMLSLQHRFGAEAEEPSMTAFSAGDQVEFTTGPFADFVAEVESIAPDRRVWLLMDLLGRQTRTAVSANALRPL